METEDTVNESPIAMSVRHPKRIRRHAVRCPPRRLLLQGLSGVRALPGAVSRCPGRARRFGRRANPPQEHHLYSGCRIPGLLATHAEGPAALVRQLLQYSYWQHAGNSEILVHWTRAFLPGVCWSTAG